MGSRITVLRAATIHDLATFPQIEQAAGEMFRTLGMDVVADDAPQTPSGLRSYVDARHAWVIERAGELAGYLITDVIDDCAHIEQVTVHPHSHGRRYGAALIEHPLNGHVPNGCPPSL